MKTAIVLGSSFVTAISVSLVWRASRSGVLHKTCLIRKLRVGMLGVSISHERREPQLRAFPIRPKPRWCVGHAKDTAAENRTPMTLHFHKLPSCLDLPDSAKAVRTDGQSSLAVRKGSARQCSTLKTFETSAVAMPNQPRNLLPCGSVPRAAKAVISSSEYTRAIGRDCATVHSSCMPPQYHKLLTRHGLPNVAIAI